MVSYHVLRTLTRTPPLNAMILQHVSLSPSVNVLHQLILRCTLLSYEGLGADKRRGNPYLILSGRQNLHHTSADQSTCGSTMSNFGWIPTWSGSMLATLPSRTYEGGLITWSSKWEQIPNSAGLNAHHVISSVYEVAYMRAITAAKPYTSAIMTVHFVNTRRNLVVHRASFDLCLRLVGWLDNSAGHPGEHVYVRRIFS